MASLLSLSLSRSDLPSPLKIASSVGTQATSSDFLKKKVSLCCSSSVSLEHQLDHSQQKELFAKYLMQLNTPKERESFEDLKRSYDQMQTQDEDTVGRVCDVRESESDVKGEVLSYFLSIWLRHMGYGTQKSKNYLQNRAKLFLGRNNLHSFGKLYQNLNLLRMSQAEKRLFLVQTCRNGWEYFVQEIARRKLLVQSSKNSQRTTINLFRK